MAVTTLETKGQYSKLWIRNFDDRLQVRDSSSLLGPKKEPK
jgi:hypothetical protein